MKKEGDKQVLIPRKEWTKEQSEANSKNRKVVSILLSSLTRKECSRVQRCDSVKDVWETLQNYHEGTSQVRQQKCQILIYEYETFMCKPHERVTNMTNRIMDIIPNLKKLGKVYSKADINHKILKALPKKLQESKVTSIKEANDLSILAHDELIGKLLTYEMENDEDENEGNNKSLAFQAQQAEKFYHHNKR